MPCQELFLSSNPTYQEQTLPSDKLRIILEAGSSYSWAKFMEGNARLITIDEFGASGSKDAVSKKVGFDHMTIQNKIIEWVNVNKNVK